MNSLLIALAAEVGAPLVEKILSEQFGNATGKLAGDVIDVIAGKSGATAEQLPAVIKSDPDLVRTAIEETETLVPEMIALYTKELELQKSVMEQDAKGPLWTWAWRPAGMWGLGVIWFWSVIVVHVTNAIYKLAIPQPPYDILMGLSALYLSLYMGGHTVKDVAGKWLGARK